MKKKPIDPPNFFDYSNNFKLIESVASKLLWGHEVNTTTDSLPMVSICIPTFKRPQLLIEAIQSVLMQVNFSDFEIVIVDNDADETYATEIIDILNKISDKRIRYYINSQNVGVFGNWNRCIELAHGTWMTILSDDDILFDNYLDVLTNELKNNSNLNRVECKYEVFEKSGSVPKEKNNILKRKASKFVLGTKRIVTYDLYISSCFTAPHSQIYKRELAYKLGGFNPKYDPISDYVFNANYLYSFPQSLFINEHLCGYRWAVNASQRKKIKLGLCKWNKIFRRYLLKLSPSIWGRIICSFRDFSELSLLGLHKQKYVKVMNSLGIRLILIYNILMKKAL